MTGLLHPHEREALQAQIIAAIDEYCRVTYDDGHRNHLGASLIGDICQRRIWYGWRWVLSGQFSGQMQRLFNRGHKEEARWIEWLRGIGFQIWDQDENGNQFRVAGIEGHFGGALDSVGLAPAWLPLLLAIGHFLVEFKTYNAKTFAKLQADKVKKAKPQHWVQMCTYGGKYNLKYALYCAICKNTDEIYIELVELDPGVGAKAEATAYDVIMSQLPPPRYAEIPTHLECKFCDYAEICHKGAPYEKNCRSCTFAVPVQGGQWFCKGYNQIIPDEVIKVGCHGWKPVGRK